MPSLFNPLQWMRSRYINHPFRVAVATLKSIFLFHVFIEYGFSNIPVQGASMLPTFEVLGDWLIVSKYYRRGREIKVGDVVQFDAVAEAEGGAVKRVLGLEGDYVLRNSPGAKNNDMIQIPKGHCWVIGDNLDWSRDSRHFGPMPMALIKGKVIAKSFPWAERKWVVNELQPEK